MATTAVVAQAGNLFQPATAIFPAITSNLVAQVLFAPLTAIHQIGYRLLICAAVLWARGNVARLVDALRH